MSLLGRKNSDRFTDIFSKVGREGKLYEKIEDVVGIDIKYMAERPSKVCRRCKGQLVCFTDFKAKAIQVQNEIHQNTTSKRCKTFSPTLQPVEKKRQPTENKSEEQNPSSKHGKIARSLFTAGEPNKSEKEQPGNVKHQETDHDILSRTGLNNPEVIKLLYLYEINATGLQSE